jgi:hypothetical protein
MQDLARCLSEAGFKADHMAGSATLLKRVAPTAEIPKNIIDSHNLELRIA